MHTQIQDKKLVWSTQIKWAIYRKIKQEKGGGNRSGSTWRILCQKPQDESFKIKRKNAEERAKIKGKSRQYQFKQERKE